MEDDGFVGALRDGPKDSAFDAGQYSFFGDLSGADDGLEGALEEGLEAPPEEELALDPDLQLREDEDLSYASMLAVGVEHDREEAAAAAGLGSSQGLRSELQHLGSGRLGESSPLPAAGAAANGAGLLGLGLDSEVPLATPPPTKLKPGSIALGGLLAGTPSSGLPGTSPLGQSTPFGSLPGSGGGFLGGGSFPQPLTPQLGQPLQDPAIAHIGPPPSTQQHLQPPLPGLPSAARPLSAEELEAQLLGGGGVRPQPPPPQFAGPPPHLQQPHMAGPGGQFPGHLPPHHHPQMPPHMSGAPPLQQPPHPMQQHPPPPPFDANGFPHFHRPPPPGMHPVLPGPARGMGPHGPLMGPPGGMPLSQRPPQLPPPGYGPPPPHMGGPPLHPPGMHGAPPPPPLGGGMPRGPMRPGMGPPPGMRPGPPGFHPPMGPPPGPHHPGPWARPQGPPQGFYPPPPQFQQPPTLAQRLRALNLADRYEADRRFPQLRRRYSSKFMDHEEIESILHMQWRPLHMGSPYAEDYYYQAFLYKHYNKRNKRTFAPESVRELAPTEKMAPDQVAFVKLEGLGKVPFSNIRRPRPLMDLTAKAPGEAAAAGGEGAEAAEAAALEAAPSNKPLEQEPLLAARIMIEDCMALLLDVEDIDRIFVATAGGPLENEGALRTRRVLLMEGFAVSLRLPEAPLAAPAEGAAAVRAEMSDGVFVRLMSLPKGKTLTARALRLVYPPSESQQQRAGRGGAAGEGEGAVPEAAAAQQPPNLRVVWAVMRNLRGLFSGKAAAGRGGKDAAFAAKDDQAATAKLATSTTDLVRALPQAQAVLDCLDAILSGDLDGSSLGEPDGLLLPLFAPGHKATDTQVPWLANVLEALLQRAAELDLAPPDSPGEEGPPSALAQLWQERFGALYAVLHRHVAALHGAFQAGKGMGDTKGCAEVRGLVPIALIRTALPHCSRAQQEEMRSMLVDFNS